MHHLFSFKKVDQEYVVRLGGYSSVLYCVSNTTLLKSLSNNSDLRFGMKL